MSAFLPVRGRAPRFLPAPGEERARRRSRAARRPWWLWGAHWLLLLPVLGICAFGLLALYSAAGGSPEPWMRPQFHRMAAGLALAFAVASVDLRHWRRLAWPAWAAGMVLLLWVELAGTTAGNATRWLRFGSFSIQPSEIMRICLVLVLARWFHGLRHGEASTKPWLLVVPALLILLPAFLVFRQPDFGTTALILALGASVVFLGGLHAWYFIAAAAAAAAAAPFLWEQLRDYQRQRLLTFLHPEQDPLGYGYHILQSKIALGSGGVFGRGYLGGTQARLDFLPEKHTDFIFTLIGEEFGLMGGLLLIALHLALFLSLLVMAWRCRSLFPRLLIAGLSVNLALYAYINIAMVSGLLPVVGVPLPLVSYGGTVAMTAFFSLGLAVSAWRSRDEHFPRRRAFSLFGAARWPR